MRNLRLSGERGATMVEFAMMAPIFFMILFGIMEMGMLYNAWVSVQDAAERGARFAVTGRTSCPSGAATRTFCIIGESQTALAQLPGNGSASITLKSWKYPTYTTVTSGDPGKACDAVEVAVTYPYQARIPLIGTKIGTLNLTGRQRFINEPFGPCTTF